MQQEIPNNNLVQEEAEFSFKDEINNILLRLLAALRKWKQWSLFLLAGALIGIAFSIFKPIVYYARTTFVVEESKTVGGGSLMSALAGQFGVDMGSLSGASGILAGDNVLQLLKSEHLVRSTLLSWYDSAKNTTLADEYARVYKLEKKWEGKVKLPISFAVLRSKPSRVEDSLLKKMIARITEKELFVAKPDKKLGFFELNVGMRSEVLSVLLSQRLLKTTTDFYIETKTRRILTNVKRLQAKADSLLLALNRKTYSAADASRMLLDVNPVFANPGVSAEISSRDKVLQGTIYAEILKNLEMSKTSLIQETPTVQLVDEPIYPLNNNRLYWWEGLFIGAFIGMCAGLLLLMLLGKKGLGVRR